jgi:ADP-ribosyl-[dinitrogen reductase] hydrolase
MLPSITRTDRFRGLLLGTAVGDALGLSWGVTGYIYHTVPVATYAWYKHFGDFEASMTAALNCGGDTDTLGAVTGALAGATVGANRIPTAWIERLWDWPRGPELFRALADRLAEGTRTAENAGPIPYFWPGLPVRSALFLAGVDVNVARRIMPPY